MATHVLKKSVFAFPPVQKQKNNGFKPKSISQSYKAQGGMVRPAQNKAGS